jgi:hypothetical protein
VRKQDLGQIVSLRSEALTRRMHQVIIQLFR